MNSFSKQNSHWYSTLTVTVECVVCWSAIPSVSARDFAAPVFVAALSVAPQPDFILDSVRERCDRPVPQAIARPDRSAPVLHRQPTDAEAWGHFDAESRLSAQSPSPVLRQVETAKVGLDTTVFAVERFVKSIRNHADFEFGQDGFRRTRANSRGKFLDNPRVMLDLDLMQCRPYIGARVVIPFGN